MPDRIILMDFDGVLNSHEWCHLGTRYTPRINQPQAKIFQRLLDETQAGIVIISTWKVHITRGQVNASGFEWMLKTHGIVANVIGWLEEYDRTDNTPENVRRVAACKHWLEKKLKDRHWIVIDDLDLTELGENRIVRTLPGRGLEPRHVGEAVEKFEAQL